MINKLVNVSFPDTLEQGFEIVLGSRVEAYLAEHPEASNAEAMAAGKDSIKGGVTPAKVDAVVAGRPRRLNLIIATPTDTQMAVGNHALELELLELGDDPPIEFDDPEISSWVADCSDELYKAVYDYFGAFM